MAYAALRKSKNGFRDFVSRARKAGIRGAVMVSLAPSGKFTQPRNDSSAQPCTVNPSMVLVECFFPLQEFDNSGFSGDDVADSVRVTGFKQRHASSDPQHPSHVRAETLI